jgi:uncharacterized membrane protein
MTHAPHDTSLSDLEKSDNTSPNDGDPKPQEIVVSTEEYDRIYQIRSEHYSSHYHGHLPSAEECERYDLLLQGSFERILAMAEKKQASDIEHQNITDKLSLYEQWVGLFGVLTGVAVFVGLVATAVYLIVHFPDNRAVITFAGALFAAPTFAFLVTIIKRR